jgi:hypothetical protein
MAGLPKGGGRRTMVMVRRIFIVAGAPKESGARLMRTIEMMSTHASRRWGGPGRPGWRSVCALAGLLLLAPAALADALFDSLRGSWSGAGQIRYVDGKAEAIKCTAFYTGEGAELRLAIRCESGNAKVEIRGQLMAQGDKLGGTWEERTFNVAGEASGRVASDKMSLDISGGGFKGAMSVSAAGGKQAVTISAEGIEMKSVNITLGKS